MISTLASADPAGLAALAEIIDVRSPAEFAEDHVPGAINLPVLDDAERARVGTIYVQQSRFEARRIGAALVARNIAGHLDGVLADRPASYAPLIYCWRGGQRSNAFATVLDQVGWRATVLAGGYKTYRRRVTAQLYDRDADLRVVLLDGFTGTAKTDILHRLGAAGTPILDLEGLASHRGSLFGAMPGAPQPSQKMFESRLLSALECLDRSRTVVVEAESSKVGEINLPPGLWKAMADAPRIVVAAPRGARARYLTQAYADIVAEPAALLATLAKLPPHHGAKRLAEWRELAAAAAFEALADSLIEHHYDPAYQRSARSDSRQTLAVLDIDDLEPPARQDVAMQIVALLQDRDR